MRDNVYKTRNVSSHKESGMERGLKMQMALGTLGLALWLTGWWLTLWCVDWFMDYSCIREPWNDVSFVCTGECPARIAVFKTWCTSLTRGTGYSSHMLAGFDEHYGSGSVAVFFTVGGIVFSAVWVQGVARVLSWLAARDAAAVQAYVAQVALAVAVAVAAVVADDADVVPWHGESEWMRVSGG